jgi:hypothetical protein
LLIFVFHPSFGQETSGPPEEEVRARLLFIESALYSAQPRAQAWKWGWVTGFSSGAVVQGGLSAAFWNKKDSDRDFAEDMLVGSATCLLGAGNMLLNPFPPAYGPNELKQMPDNTPEERRAKLLKAETLLRKCADREKKGRSLLTHALNLGVNLAAGIVTVAAFDRPWSDGLITFGTNEAVSLLNIFTQPRRAIHDLENYESGSWEVERSGHETRAGLDWHSSISPAGFQLRIIF